MNHVASVNLAAIVIEAEGDADDPIGSLRESQDQIPFGSIVERRVKSPDLFDQRMRASVRRPV